MSILAWTSRIIAWVQLYSWGLTHRRSTQAIAMMATELVCMMATHICVMVIAAPFWRQKSPSLTPKAAPSRPPWLRIGYESLSKSKITITLWTGRRVSEGLLDLWLVAFTGGEEEIFSKNSNALTNNRVQVIVSGIEARASITENHLDKPQPQQKFEKWRNYNLHLLWVSPCHRSVFTLPQLHELLFFLSNVRGLFYHYDDDDDDDDEYEYDDVLPQKWRAQTVLECD